MSSRDAQERHVIADILDEFDAIAIAEVNDSQILEELEAILDGSGVPWESVTSARVGRSPQTAEHYGVLFRDDRLELRSAWELPDLAFAEVEIDDLDVDPAQMFDRKPFAVILATDDGRLDFALVITHVTWGSRVGPRIAEVRLMGRYYEEVFPQEPDVLIVGDLNRNAGDARSLGWLAERFGLIDTTEPGLPTVIDAASSYDHILLHPGHTAEFTGVRGVVPFDETLFENDDEAAERVASDHRPVWIELAVSAGDDD